MGIKSVLRKLGLKKDGKKHHSSSLLVSSSTTSMDEDNDNQQSNPPELGHVAFSRDLNAAILKSKQLDLPIFLLFQEIPGCITCTRFGKNVLSSREIVNAISNAFIPVVINNRCHSQEDEDTCKAFNEPMLNNPVVRFIDFNKQDLIERKSGVYARSEIKSRMKQALFKAKRSDLLLHIK